MNKDGLIKCPKCHGLRCRGMTRIKPKMIDICTFYENRVCSSNACVFRCDTCNANGYISWIDSFFYRKENRDISEKYFKRDIKLLEDVAYYNWMCNNKTLTIKEVKELYKDVYYE